MRGPEHSQVEWLVDDVSSCVLTHVTELGGGVQVDAVFRWNG